MKTRSVVVTVSAVETQPDGSIRITATGEGEEHTWMANPAEPPYSVGDTLMVIVKTETA